MLERRRRWLRVPVLIERGKNVEYGKDVRDDKAQVSESKVSSRTNPKSLAFSVAGSQIPTLGVPSSAAKDPSLRIPDRWVDRSVLGEKPFWVEGFWVRVDVFVVTYCPVLCVKGRPASVEERTDQMFSITVAPAGMNIPL